MILDYNRKPDATVDEKVQSLMESTQFALNDISRAQQTADVAKEDAQTSIALSQAARQAANEASEEAGRAMIAADRAESEALRAGEAADRAETEANRAYKKATEAEKEALRAGEAADRAETEANRAYKEAEKATGYANDSLSQLGIVEDVVGTLNWITTHATYKATVDTEVHAGKWYFTKSGDTYNVVVNPTGNPSAKGYYEVDTIDEAVSNYVASHLALTNEGLYLTKDGNGYKILLANDGLKVYDPEGHLVSTFGESIIFDSARPQTIGNNNVYIKYYDKNNDGTPDSLAIKADEFLLSSGKTIQEEIEAVENWFYSVAPTTSNPPASSWTTTSLKEQHLRDIYFDTTSGKSYRWAKEGTTYKWVEIEDVELAALAKDLHDNYPPRSEFTVAPDKIQSTVSAAQTAATNAANTATDNKLTSYSTTTQMNSAIEQKAGEINLSVDKKISDVISVKEASGSIVHVEDASEYPALDCKVALDPVQDLHGYDKPWAGGNGKNKLPLTVENIKTDNQRQGGSWSGNVYTLKGITFTILTDDSDNVIGIRANGTATANADMRLGVYTFASNSIMNGVPNGGGSTSYRMQVAGTNYLTDGGDVSIPNGTSGRVYIRIFKGYTANNLVFKPMIRLASESDASFAPYSNICPISGHDEVNVYVSPNTTGGTTYTTALGRTVYGGTLDVTSGVLKVCPYYASYNGETLTGEWVSDRDEYSPNTSPTIGAQVVNIGGSLITVQLTPQEVDLLTGQNNVWADSGDTYLKYVTMNSDMLSLMDKSNADLERAKAEIKITTDGITSEVSKKVGNSEVISKINQSAESVKIQASKVEVDGTLIIGKSQADAAYDAKGSASAAAKTATSYITAIDNNCIRVHPASTQNNSAVINANGMEVFKGGTDSAHSVAFYGDTARIGKEASSHIFIDTNNIVIRDGLTELASFGADATQIGADGATHGVFSSNFLTFLTENDDHILVAGKSPNDQYGLYLGTDSPMHAGVTLNTFPSDGSSICDLTARSEPNTQHGYNDASLALQAYLLPSGSKYHYIIIDASQDGWNGIQASTNITVNSDERLKKNFEGAEKISDLIMHIKPIIYSWKDERTNQRHLGFKAQDVIEALMAVADDADDYALVSEGKDGYFNLSYSELIPLIVDKLQKQQKTIDTLEKRIEALERISK